MKVVISGSFRKHLQGILKLKRELEERGIEVIKPNRIKTINNIDNPDFVKFEGEANIHPYVLLCGSFPRCYKVMVKTDPRNQKRKRK